MKTEELEKKTQREIIDLLVLNGCIVLRINNIAIRKGQRFIRSVIRGGTNDGKGVSDIIGCTKYGRFFAIEVKRKGEFPTDEQRAFLADVERIGGIAILAYDLSEVLARMEDSFQSSYGNASKRNIKNKESS